MTTETLTIGQLAAAGGGCRGTFTIAFTGLYRPMPAFAGC